MNFDRRRINGPEATHELIYENSSHVKHLNERSTRKNDELRPVFIKPGLISSASGSTYIECGNTKIACAVYGPKQIKNAPYSSTGKLNVEIKHAPFSSSIRRDPVKELEATHLSSQVTQALLPSLRLENYEKMQIDLFVTIIQDDSLDFGLLANITTAAGTALASAGLEMNGLVVGATVAFKEDEMLLDPSPSEVKYAKAVMTVCTLPALTQIAHIWQAGTLDMNQYKQALQITESASRNIHTLIAKTLMNETNA
ncbi:ribosomal protein S5 domain 2-like protein [Wallemia mellicola]|uniref:Ribosomal protein S5 domain 2-like protein n=1 Tax=Wallemia mellicola TaxID=1708541 RepID=A0A4T0S7B1_9BASI|nr:hypothetical protein E3Q24_00243 [Wallemia mellicola]TIB78505.1 hypothetical protein E3Q23_00764 [Wallemia mellicola]TIB81258.1 ribosomal protein S5 domain 2-like protein [Wallemia mellicola]TIB89107.1 ribosomal protein S5 domain 2-like protein [Wallemia mellicola]TIB91629.1 ribosomal protein S5 domain 2-like protein [Wallemia mellicola]